MKGKLLPSFWHKKAASKAFFEVAVIKTISDDHRR